MEDEGNRKTKMTPNKVKDSDSSPRRTNAPSHNSRLSLSQKGFSLVEVLVAIVILATGLVLVIEALGRTQHALRISKNLMIASQIVEEEIVKKEMQVRQDHKLRTGTDQERVKLPGRQFDVETSIHMYRGENIIDETKLNQFDVLIKWTEGGVRKNDLLVSTVLLNREKQQQ